MAERRIYCPICKRKVFSWDGKIKQALDAKCKNCNKLVVFYPSTNETVIKPLPKANSASGKRLY